MGVRVRDTRRIVCVRDEPQKPMAEGSGKETVFYYMQIVMTV
jgi:hypothetical protein